MAVVSLLACSLRGFAQGAPTAAEAAMVASVDRNAAANVELLRQIVEINSGTTNLEGVRAVADVLEPRLKALGFVTRRVNQDKVHRAGHLIAEHACPKGTGKCGKRMLLIGHMDTVFDKDSPFQHWAVEGDTATGPGSNDMKGGLVVMLASLQAMQDAGVLKDTEMIVVLHGDEEAHGTPASVSRSDIVEAAKRSDVALEFEATARQSGKYYGSISRRSSSDWKLTASGKSGHSSGIFSKSDGYGAIYELVRILDAFRVELPEEYLTFNVGKIAGGSRMDVSPGQYTAYGKGNIIPPVAIAMGDLRTISDEQTERVRTKMRTIVAKHLPGTDAEITFGEGYPAMPPTEASRAVLRTLNQVNATLGQPEMPELDPLLRGAGDIAFVASIVPGLAGVGASGKGSHAPGETVDLPSQVLNAKRDALLMYRLSRD